jgi:transaldolase
MNALQKLQKSGTIIVLDTGNIDEIKRLLPHDATTNPSLIAKVATKNKSILEFSVDLGIEILKVVPGYVSTEVDPIHSFDTYATIDNAIKIMDLYMKKGADCNRVLIKIAATWQGIRAAKILEKSGIKCNMTLIFSLTQARACAEAGVTLISPFVGRITDWYVENKIEFDEDPGVQSVSEIYKYLKSYGYPTIVMGASFRNINQIMSLAGCDRLTISPKLTEELYETIQTNFESKIKFVEPLSNTTPPELTETQFYLEMAKNKMAWEKLNSGILKFIEDSKKIY